MGRCGKQAYQWNSSGDAILTNEFIELKRLNSEGIYEIEIRPNGHGEPSI